MFHFVHFVHLVKCIVYEFVQYNIWCGFALFDDLVVCVGLFTTVVFVWLSFCFMASKPNAINHFYVSYSLNWWGDRFFLFYKLRSPLWCLDWHGEREVQKEKEREKEMCAFVCIYSASIHRPLGSEQQNTVALSNCYEKNMKNVINW